MNLENFHALTIGKAPLQTYDFETKTHSYKEAKVHNFLIGQLHIPSGKLATSDPYVNIENPIFFNIPAGTYPAYVTTADVSPEQNGTHYRECYLSILLTDKETITIEPAIPADTTEELEEGQSWGISVDAGIVGFFDYEAGQQLANSFEDEDDLFDMFENNLTQQNGAETGILNPENIEGNFIYSHSGWGDGFYPVLKTLDKNGETTGYHIDLNVIGMKNQT